MIRLRDVYQENGEPHQEAVALLYQLLAERPPEANISHSKMPTFEEHTAFVRSRPYRAWYIICDHAFKPLGAIYATQHNELGIFILCEHQNRGHATMAIRVLKDQLEPLPAIPGKRRGRYLANVSPHNRLSKKLFEKLGGRIVSLTYEI